MSIERPAQATSYKLQATDSSYKLQDTSQPICKTFELPSYKLQATSDKLQIFRTDRFSGLTFPTRVIAINILAGMKPPEVCLLWKKGVEGRRSRSKGADCSGRSDLGGRRLAVGWANLLWVVGMWAIVGESSLDAERSCPKRQNVAVGDLFSDSSVFSRLETRRINWVILKILNKSHKFF